ncbi:tetratricopeptide repeat protein [Sphingobacterium sp. LRF_L2]|uniref:tetratricopeptide repeat protein n=1 Tax=Sphingobacterium sp. LRF_L2 TaxID=3369421 RepID=UPI003F622F44
MLRFFLLSTTLIFSLFCVAQELNDKIDSVGKLLIKHTGKDSIRLHLLQELSYFYYSIDPSKGLAFAEEAIQLASHLRNNTGLAISYSRKGINHWAKGEDSLAMDASNRSLALYKAMGNLSSYAKGLNNRALNHYNQGNYIAAIRDHEEALSIFTARKDNNGVLHCHVNMGVVFLALDDYPRALASFLSALRINDPSLDQQAHINSNIGLVYKNMKEYHKAYGYQSQALKLYRQTGNKQGIANVLGNIATLHNLSGQHQKAITSYQEALTINREIGNLRLIASDLTNLGIVYKLAGQLDEGMKYLHQAVEVYAKTNDQSGYAEALLFLSESYTRAHKEKIIMQLKALDIAVRNGFIRRQSEALEALSRSYEEKGEFQKALQLYREHAVLQDSILGEQKGKAVLRQQLEFDFEKKEAQIQAEVLRQKDIRNSIFICSSLLLASLLLVSFFYKRNRDADSRKKHAEHESKVAETELKALRAQMNPHFIFNSLNAIYDSLCKDDVINARKYLPKFAKLMRQTLTHSSQKEILLAEDIAFITLYLELEQMRLHHTFTYQITVEEGIQAEKVLVPPMLMQPLIENSIWHGLRQHQPGHIAIHISREEHLLCMCIEDNGVGMPSSYQEQSTTPSNNSFGLHITRERLSLLDKQKGSLGLGELRIKNNPGGQGVIAEIRLLFKPLAIRTVVPLSRSREVSS